jgi:kinesin family protein 5
MSQQQQQQPAAECIKVAIRVRPLPEGKMDDDNEACCRVVGNTVEARGKSFAAMDHALDGDVSQSIVFEKLVAPLLPDLTSGINATVMAYGQTGSVSCYLLTTVISVISVISSIDYV